MLYWTETLVNHEEKLSNTTWTIPELLGTGKQVVMERACRDPSQWQGSVGLRLGSCLYLDCSADVGTDAFEQGVKALKEEVHKRMGCFCAEADGGHENDACRAP